MKKESSVDWSKAGRKSWESRRKNIVRKRSSDAGKKAWKETIRPSEYGYMEELISAKKAKPNELFHHEGLPDIMMITESGRIEFYEIKPKKAASERRLLNPRQKKNVKSLLTNKMVEGVTIVYYEKKGKKHVYSSQQKITLSNIDKYSL